MGIMPREKLVLIGGGVVAALLLVVMFVIEPAISSHQKRGKNILALEQRLAEVKALAEQLRGQGKNRRGIVGAKQRPVKALMPWLESQLDNYQLTRKLEQIYPKRGDSSEAFREVAVFKLQDVNVESLLSLLQQIDRQGELQLIEADMRRSDDAGVNFSAEVGLR